MNRKPFCVFLFLVLVAACTASQQQVMQKVAEKTPAILASIAKVYGGPYAGLVQSFYEIAMILGDGQGTPGMQVGQPGYAGFQQPGQGYPAQPQGTYSASSYPGSQQPGQGFQAPSQGSYGSPTYPGSQQTGQGYQGPMQGASGASSYPGSQPYDQGYQAQQQGASGASSYPGSQQAGQGIQAPSEGPYGTVSYPGAQPSDQGYPGSQQGAYGASSYPGPQQPGQGYTGAMQAQPGAAAYPGSAPSGQGYQTSPQGTYATGSQPLEVEMDVVKEVMEYGKYTARSIKDGDVLTQKDNYKIIFRARTECFIYIAQLDSTGKMDPIFPSAFASEANPVRPGMAYAVPSDRQWFYLDENYGVETIYFIASRTPLQDLETLFLRLTEQNKQLVKRGPISINDSVVIMRGVGGVRQGQNAQVTFPDGSKGGVTPSLLSSIKADFVTTRWFNHR